MLFLGEWCCRYRRRSAWQNLDVVLARPYGLGQANKDADREAARILETALFADVCAILNDHHGLQESQRYWRIVLGHWFRRCVDILFNRTRTLQQCLDEQQPKATVILTGERYHLATQDSNAAVWASNDDLWNHQLFARILQNLQRPGLELLGHDVTGPSGFEWQPGKPGKVGRRNTGLYGTLVALQRKVDKVVNRNARTYIQNSYLPRLVDFRLQALMGQFPRLPADPVSLPPVAISGQLRADLSARLSQTAASEVERVARELIFELLPACFLEGFGAVSAAAATVPWPLAPDTIFTSNSFDTDEVFKVWSAEKVKRGARYILGQHGNNYGAHRYFAHHSIEEEVADQFLTWGWQDGLPQHTPAFIFKTVGKKPTAMNDQGGLLLIEMPAQNRIVTWDSEAEFARYIEDQKSFVSALQSEPRAQLNIRLHPASAHLDWDEVARWNEFDGTLKIDRGGRPISEMLSASRLVVHGYDSTGILECIAMDIPMIAFWNDGLDHVRDSARPYYQALVDAGLFHLSADSAARHVNAIWGDVGGWWRSPEVVAARLAFAGRYAVASRAPARDLRQILARA